MSAARAATTHHWRDGRHACGLAGSTESDACDQRHPPRAANSTVYGASLLRDGTTLPTKVRGVREIFQTDEVPYAEYPGDSQAYVMVRATSAGYLAKMGFMARDVNDFWYFYEHNDAGVAPRLNIFQADTSDEQSFEVVWTEGNGGEHEFLFWFGLSHTIQTLVTSPVLHWSPDDGQLGGRTQSREPISWPSEQPYGPRGGRRPWLTVLTKGSALSRCSEARLLLGPTSGRPLGRLVAFRSWDRDCP